MSCHHVLFCPSIIFDSIPYIFHHFVTWRPLTIGQGEDNLLPWSCPRGHRHLIFDTNQETIGHGTPKDMGPNKGPTLFPNPTPIIESLKIWGNSMGPAYHKGVPCPWESRVNHPWNNLTTNGTFTMVEGWPTTSACCATWVWSKNNIHIT